MSDKVSEFQAVTNSDAETAQFYLESSGGDLTTALESYYANVDMHPPQEPPSTERPSSHRPQPPVHLLFSKPSFQITLQVASFADMDEDDSSDGPEDNEYYAGGQNSGVAIRGGKKRDHVENLFESVREHGAIQGLVSISHSVLERWNRNGRGFGYPNRTSDVFGASADVSG